VCDDIIYIYNINIFIDNCCNLINRLQLKICFYDWYIDTYYHLELNKLFIIITINWFQTDLKFIKENKYSILCILYRYIGN